MGQDNTSALSGLASFAKLQNLLAGSRTRWLRIMFRDLS
jgi:hypothetical protein